MIWAIWSWLLDPLSIRPNDTAQASQHFDPRISYEVSLRWLKMEVNYQRRSGAALFQGGEDAKEQKHRIPIKLVYLPTNFTYKHQPFM